MFSQLMAGGRAVLTAGLYFVIGIAIGGLLATTPTDDEPDRSTPTSTVATMTPEQAEEVTRLADALEGLTTTTVPAAARPLVEEAEDVLAELAPESTPAEPAPAITTSTTLPVTTTTSVPPAPSTTTTAPPLVDWIGPPPPTVLP